MMSVGRAVLPKFGKDKVSVGVLSLYLREKLQERGGKEYRRDDLNDGVIKDGPVTVPAGLQAWAVKATLAR